MLKSRDHIIQMMKALSYVFILMLSHAAQAASPNQFVYEGYLTDASGNASNGSLTFKFEIYDPNGTCLLYSENQTLTVTNGNFSAAIGAGTRNSGDPGLTMTQVFNNQSGSTITGASSCTYSVVSKDNRLLRVTVGSETLTPDIAVNSVPFANFADNSDHAAMADSATNATTLNGKADTAFAQINANTTQSKLDNFFTGSTASQVTNLVNGTATSNTGAITLPVGTTGQQPSSPVQGMIRYNTTSSQTEVYNGSAWTAVGGATGSYLSLTGGAMSGNIDMSNNSLNNISSTNIGVASIGSTTITVPTAATKALVINAAASQSANLLEVYDSSHTLQASIAPTATVSTTYNLTTKGYVDTANSNQDTTIAGKVNKAGDTMAGNLTISSHSQVRYGDSGSNYVALQAPTTVSTSYTLTLPSSITAGGYLTTDASGNLSWGTPSGGGSVISVGLSAPSLFSVSNSPVTSSGTIALNLVSQSANTIFAAPDAASGNPSFRSLVANDIPSLDASKISSGVLPVANGGTNSSTALNNNRVMISSGGKIVETSAITANRAMASDASGLPVASSVTDTELGYLSGITSSVQTQINGKVSKAGGDTITASAATVKPLVLKGAVSQTANLFEVQDSTGTLVASVSSTGATTASPDIVTKAYVDTNSTAKVTRTGDTMSGALNMGPIGTSAGNGGIVKFGELAANGSNIVALRAPDSIASDVIWTLPAADGTSGQVLSTNGSGGLSWASPSGGTITSVNAGTGLSGGGSSGGVTLSLANTAVTAGSYTRANITVDGQGRLTSASNGASVSLTTEVTGTLPIANGGTGVSAAPTQGGIIYAASSSGYASTSAGTTNQILVSGGTGAPAWSSATLAGATLTMPAASTITSASGNITLKAGSISGTTTIGNSSGASPIAILGGTSGISLSAAGGTSFTGSMYGPQYKSDTGTSTAPAYTYNLDTTTGMFFPSTGLLAFSTNGNEQLRIDGSGNIGVGTSNPTNPLTVQRTFASGNTLTYLYLSANPSTAGNTSTFYGGMSTADYTATVGASTPSADANVTGFKGVGKVSSGAAVTVASATGVLGTAVNATTSATIANATGVMGIINTPNAGPITNAVGVAGTVMAGTTSSVGNAYGGMFVAGGNSGSITGNSYGVYVDLSSNAGSATSFGYGVYVGPVNSSTNTANNYGIYSAANNNAFTGAVAVGKPNVSYSATALDVKGHIASSGVSPTIGSCGSGGASISGNSTDTRGTITVGSSATSCSIIFNADYSSSPTPVCVVSWAGGSAVSIFMAVSTTYHQMTVSFSSIPSGSPSFNYICMQ